MGQLIKLQDYVSRYEQNIFIYPSRYVRLKKEQWEKLQMLWESGAKFEEPSNHSTMDDFLEEERHPILTKVKEFLKFGRSNIELIDKDSENNEEKEPIEESTFQFTPSFSFRPDSMEDLKRQFLNQLFSFQMKWASTTLTEKSYVNKKFYYDEKLKYFLQRFPDTFLVLYNPIFLLKKAPVEVETILITPSDVWCISFLEKEDLSVFVGSSDRFWMKRNQGKDEKILSPLLALNRTGKIVKKIFELYEIDLPIHKIVLSRNGYVDYPTAPYDIQFIEKRNYDKWFQSMRARRTPFKHVQFKAAQSLMQYCQTTSTHRVEWELDMEQDQ